jgi:hypothetical protein
MGLFAYLVEDIPEEVSLPSVSVLIFSAGPHPAQPTRLPQRESGAGLIRSLTPIPHPPVQIIQNVPDEEEGIAVMPTAERIQVRDILSFPLPFLTDTDQRGGR